jgi:hypothetical protein
MSDDDFDDDLDLDLDLPGNHFPPCALFAYLFLTNWSATVVL